MKWFLLSILCNYFFYVQAQGNVIVAQHDISGKRRYSEIIVDEGQECLWAKKALRKCKKKVFNGSPQIIGNFNDSIFSYGNSVLVVDVDEEFIDIFRLGIIYSGLFNGEAGRGEADSVSSPQSIYRFLSNDTIFISDMEELSCLRKKERRGFRFLVWRKGIANPSLYFFELECIDGELSLMKDFIRHATLSRICFYSILL